MSILRKILKFIFGEPRKLQDDFFGEMIEVQGYYECYAYFNPINKNIELGIGGDYNGPTIEARQFYEKIEREYSKLIEILSPFVQEEFNRWNPKVKINKFEDEFEAIYLFIPDCRATKIEWTIAFETIHDSHLFTIEMKDYVPDSIMIDG